jgi:DNA-directed RNA polymerase specialized sigma24 family protein
MSDTTDTQNQRLSRLFELHNARLVRALRARLGRYNWHLAEELAAATWLHVVEAAGTIPAVDPGRQFVVLCAMARAEMNSYLSRGRIEVLTDFSGALPDDASAGDVELDRMAAIDFFPPVPALAGVAA